MRHLIGNEVSSSDQFTFGDIRWAAEECHRQRSGEMSVARLLEALHYARSVLSHRDLTLNDISYLGWLIEPSKNNSPGGSLWRSVRVTIGGVVPLPDPDDVPRNMELLLKAWSPGEKGLTVGKPYLETGLSADDWYREFEEIHPFVDGNGRVGSILWNLHRGTLGTTPSAPPDFWSKKVPSDRAMVLLGLHTGKGL